jgi:hypothetical protein
MDSDKLRAWRWTRQGLDGSLSKSSAAEVLERTGWSRSVGGASPYLALFARAGLSRTAVDEAAAKLQIHELPSARGCTYVVPAGDFGLALQASQGHGDAADIATAKKFLGVTDKEIDKLCGAVAGALSKGPLDPRELKEALGAAVRNLGLEGKKRGTTTTLPLALGKLQTEGRIRRVPANGRLDQQRYAYTLWQPAPKLALSAEEVAVELARRFFRWAAPATSSQLAWWAALGAKAAKAAAAALKLVPAEEGDERLMFAEDRDALASFTAPKAPQYALVGGLDNIAHLRRELASLLDAADAKRMLPGDKGAQRGGTLLDLPYHGIFDRGRLIGFWEYDVAAEKLVWATMGKAAPALQPVVARMEAFVRDQLGDARSFSLDSPESRGPRLAALRKLAA